MTAKISQHVVPRPRYGFGRQARHRRSFLHSGRRVTQRGSITHSTITTALGVSTLVIMALLGFFYLQQVMQTASQGTDVHALETKLIELKQKQRELELQGAQLRSLQTVEDRVQKLNLNPTDHVSYMQPTSDHVAALP